MTVQKAIAPAPAILLSSDVPGEHLEDELAAAGGHIDALLEAAEPDHPVTKRGERVNDVADRPAEAIKLPDDNGVPLASEGRYIRPH